VGIPPKRQATLDSLTELALKRAWPKLGRQTRQVMYLAIVKGFKNKEIADMLDISFHTVYEQLWRAVQKAHAKTRRQAYAFYAIRFNQENKMVCKECKDTKKIGLCSGCGTEENDPHHHLKCQRTGFTQIDCPACKTL